MEESIHCSYSEKGSKLDVKNYRGIAIQAVIPKIFDALINMKLRQHLAKIFPEQQHELKPGRKQICWKPHNIWRKHTWQAQSWHYLSRFRQGVRSSWSRNTRQKIGSLGNPIPILFDYHVIYHDDTVSINGRRNRWWRIIYCRNFRAPRIDLRPDAFSHTD